MKTKDMIQYEVATFLNELTINGRQPSTIKRYQYDLDDYINWLTSEKKLQKWLTLSSNDFKQFFLHLQQKRKYSNATLKRIRTVLNKFYSYIKKQYPTTMIELPPLQIDHSKNRKLSKQDFLSDKEEQALRQIITSEKDLTEHQLPARQKLFKRNETILTLLLDYGLTLHECVSLKMKYLSFIQKTLYIESSTSLSRTLKLKEEHKNLIYTYIHAIPEPVRPRYSSDDALLIAFDFNRDTFRWNYDTDRPKPLSEIALQKMIREEVSRAQLRKGISAQHMRNSCILKALQSMETHENIKARFGFKTMLSLKRYLNYLQEQ